MKYYKTLLCDNFQEINQEILQHIQTVVNIDTTPVFWNPISVVDFTRATSKLQQWLKNQKLQIASLAVTVAKSPDYDGAHLDAPPCVYKLSWPILNTEYTFNRWFEPLTDDLEIETFASGGVRFCNQAQLKELDRKRVDTPMLICVNVPHDVYFEPHAVFPRLGLQCRLFNEPKTL